MRLNSSYSSGRNEYKKSRAGWLVCGTTTRLESRSPSFSLTLA